MNVELTRRCGLYHPSVYRNQTRARLSERAVGASVNAFAFQRREGEAHHRIVVRIIITVPDDGRTPHLAAPVPERHRPISAPMIRVMDDAGLAPLRDRHVQGREHQFPIQVTRHHPDHHASAPRIEHGGEVQEAFSAGTSVMSSTQSSIGPRAVNPRCTRSLAVCSAVPRRVLRTPWRRITPTNLPSLIACHALRSDVDGDLAQVAGQARATIRRRPDRFGPARSRWAAHGVQIAGRRSRACAPTRPTRSAAPATRWGIVIAPWSIPPSQELDSRRNRDNSMDV